jgi:hypothetical protein
MMTRNVLAGFILFLMIIGSAYATCQYANFVNVSSQVPVVFFNGEKYYGEPVLKTNFIHKSIGQEHTWTCVYQDSFDLVNQLPSPMKVRITYAFQNGINQTTMTIPASSTQTVSVQYSLQWQGSICLSGQNLAPPQLDFDSVKIEYQSGQFELKNETQINETRVCRECPEKSGQVCRNDGDYANADYLCGSGYRDSSGVCAPPSTGFDLNKTINDLGKSIQNILIEIIIVIILIIFFWVALTGKREVPPPSKIIHVWDND